MAAWNPGVVEAARLRPLNTEAALQAAELAWAADSENVAACCVLIAVLGDAGQHVRAAEMTSELALRFGPSRYTAATATRALRNAGEREASRIAGRLWSMLESGAEAQEIARLHHQLQLAVTARPRMPRPGADRRADEGRSPGDSLVERIHSLRIDQRHSFRVLQSRRQLDRAAHHLRNCLSGYWTAVKSGACLIATIERDGVPIEALELVDTPARVVEWKGRYNRPPDPRLAPRALAALRTAGVALASPGATQRAAADEPF